MIVIIIIIISIRMIVIISNFYWKMGNKRIPTTERIQAFRQTDPR